ncbi:hypothetical protein PFISCL1PPCAC_8654, partial [Pristionchus fissidentatus]
IEMGDSDGQAKEMAFNVTEFVEKRAAQIHDLLAVIDNSSLVAGEVTKGPRTAAQRLPRHMRRRAMSHNVKRMPRRFRAFARPFLERSKHRKKPPSRFARRRPRNLLLNYVRRQRSDAWLETHIWHAKRFHMVQRWSYRIPDRSFQRAFRPIYRTTRRGAVVRDKSYLSCLLLSAPAQSTLIAALSPLCCPATVEASVRGVGGRDGRREVNTLLYRKDAYPRGLIGPARFQWSTSAEGRAQLALWVHPACRAAVMAELQLLLQLKKWEEPQLDEETKRKLDSPDNITEWRAARASVLTEVYEGEGGVRLEDLRDQLVRLRLVGPKSLRVLAESLLLVEEGEETREYEQQHTCWREVYTRVPPGELQDGLAISLLVEDHRCGRPARRGLLASDVPPPSVDPDEVEHPTPAAAIWSREERLRTMETRLSNSAMAELRGSSIGGRVDRTAAKLPVMVVVRSAAAEEMTMSGADVIVPAGFGVDLWIALQMRTARASGLRDELAAHAESSTPAFPADTVDARAGEEESRREKREKEDKHLSRPWNRRPSFWDGLSVKYPFSFEWAELVRDWSKCGKEVAAAEPYVLRDRRLLESLRAYLAGRGGEQAVKRLGVIVKEHAQALVPIQLDAVARGRPRRFALICLGNRKEVARKRKKGEEAYTEPARRGEIKDQPGKSGEKGEEEEERMEEGEDEKEMSKAEKDQWQNEMWKDVVSTETGAREKTISLKEMFASKLVSKERKRSLLNRKKKLRQKRRRLTAGARAADAQREVLEKEATSYRTSATREICGRVLRGDFCFTAAKGRAIGLVPIAVLAEMRERRAEVLFRNTTSAHYHPAKATVSMARLTL